MQIIKITQCIYSILYSLVIITIHFIHKLHVKTLIMHMYLKKLITL